LSQTCDIFCSFPCLSKSARIHLVLLDPPEVSFWSPYAGVRSPPQTFKRFPSGCVVFLFFSFVTMPITVPCLCTRFSSANYTMAFSMCVRAVPFRDPSLFAAGNCHSQVFFYRSGRTFFAFWTGPPNRPPPKGCLSPAMPFQFLFDCFHHSSCRPPRSPLAQFVLIFHGLYPGPPRFPCTGVGLGPCPALAHERSTSLLARNRKALRYWLCARQV